MPALPSDAQLSEAELEASRKCGTWLEEYYSWISNRATMTDPLFLESGGFWVLSLAVARRAVLSLNFGDIHPNLYVMWVAGTTYWRKSTALRQVAHLVHKVFPHMLFGCPEYAGNADGTDGG